MYYKTDYQQMNNFYTIFYMRILLILIMPIYNNIS